MSHHSGSRRKRTARPFVRFVAALTAAGAALGHVVGADAAETTPSSPATQELAEIAWQPCEADTTAECGTLTVPIDWQRPDGETIDLSLTRRPAQDQANRIGSLVYLAGGPGDPGALTVLHADLSQLFSADLLDRFDIVGFDPRGVGNSHPVQCSMDLLDAKPDPYLTSQRQFRERVRYNDRLRADCRERTGPLFDHVDTRSVVHDLDAIRAGLGEDALTAFGFSYGTAIGQQYAEEYPERVRALALDGNVDHSADTARWTALKAEQVQGVFDAFVSWCASDARCVLHDRDVRALWHDVLGRADAGEFAGIDSQDVIGAVFECGYGPAWTEIAGFLDELDTGATTPEVPCAGEDLPEERHNRGLNIANFCADYHLPVRNYRHWRSLVDRTGREHAPDMRHSPNGIGRIADCLGQDRDVPNPQHELDVSGSEPVLLINPLVDPITGHNQATVANRQMGDESVLLTYEGAGHTAYISGSDCVTGIVDDYLIDTTVPADGTRCPGEPYRPA